MRNSSCQRLPVLPQRWEPGLSDRFGRRLSYLRVSLGDRCNLRCVYCMPADGVAFAPRGALLSAVEIQRAVRVAVALGVSKVRFTGGEPLLRPDALDIMEGVSKIPGLSAVHLTTNGLRLGQCLGRLKSLGLAGVNVSLDTLDPSRYRRITRRFRSPEAVLESVAAVLEAGIPAKINVVLMRGLNDDELSGFLALTERLCVVVRFIEFMPFDAQQKWAPEHFLSAREMITKLRALGVSFSEKESSPTEDLRGRVPGFFGQVAVIGAHSRLLCASCDRLRLTADGQLRNCLYSEREFDVRSVLRSSSGDDAVAAVFRRAADHKLADGRAAERASTRRVRLSMTQIGG